MPKSENKKHNMFFIRFNDNDYEVSEEFTTQEGQDFVIDLDKDGKICGIEIFDYRKQSKEK